MPGYDVYRSQAVDESIPDLPLPVQIAVVEAEHELARHGLAVAVNCVHHSSGVELHVIRLGVPDWRMFVVRREAGVVAVVLIARPGPSHLLERVGEVMALANSATEPRFQGDATGGVEESERVMLHARRFLHRSPDD